MDKFVWKLVVDDLQGFVEDCKFNMECVNLFEEVFGDIYLFHDVVDVISY